LCLVLALTRCKFRFIFICNLYLQKKDKWTYQGESLGDLNLSDIFKTFNYKKRKLYIFLSYLSFLFFFWFNLISYFKFNIIFLETFSFLYRRVSFLNFLKFFLLENYYFVCNNNNNNNNNSNIIKELRILFNDNCILLSCRKKLKIIIYKT